MFALKKHIYYVYGVYVDVFTYHKSLEYVFTQNVLNLQQRRWLDLVKDYDMKVLYNPNKSSVVVDVLSRTSVVSVAHVENEKKKVSPCCA